MLIAGMQRCSLVDYPGRLACTLFCQGCNLRCPWCHNASLIGPRCSNPLPEDDVFDFLRARHSRLEAVVVTGGEPTTQRDLIPFLQRLKAFDYTVKLDTNGTRPELIKTAIAQQCVDYIAMDVKAPKEKYNALAGAPVSITSIQKSIDLLMADDIDYEFRTTVIPELLDISDITAIARWLTGGRILFLQAFQPQHALSPTLRNCHHPSPELLEACQTTASQYLPCRIRN